MTELKLPSMKDQIIPNISGSWYGHDQQLRHGIPIKSKINCEISQSGNEVTGRIEFIPDTNSDPIYISGDLNRIEAQINGEWIKGKVLKMDWSNNDDYLFVGGAYLELMHNGEKLAGKFVGFGPESYSVVSGEIILRRG